MWDLDKDGKTPINVKNDYFSKNPDGSHVNFNQDHYLPFIQKYFRAIKQVKSSYIVLFEPIPGSDPPDWKGSEDNHGLVYAPHWYDLKSVFSKVMYPQIIFSLLTDLLLMTFRGLVR